MQITSGTNTLDRDFETFIQRLRNACSVIKGPVFTTSATDSVVLAYLETYRSAAERQHFNCRACKDFLRKYGGLAQITKGGRIKPLLWNLDMDYGDFQDVADALSQLVVRSEITGVFKSDLDILGTPESNGWRHFSIKTPQWSRNTSRLQTAHQVTAEKLGDFQMVERALSKYSLSDIDKAVHLLRTNNLPRSELALGNLEWFQMLKTSVKSGRFYENMIWAAIADAPSGFTHINNNIGGELLDMIVNNEPFDVIRRKFTGYVDGLNYRRPQTAPTEQNINRGNEIFKKLGLENSVKRRFANLEDLQLLWTPRKSTPRRSEGVFSSVTPRNEAPSRVTRSNASPVVMTFEKFKRVILPEATEMYIQVPGRGNYSAFVTAEDPTAPLIFQWSNPVNWYVYSGGSFASDWNLSSGSRVKVTGVSLQPNMWKNEATARGEGVTFLLEKCYPRISPGLALFPETLLSELHEVRKTIEEFSRKGTISGRAGATGCGLKFPDGKNLKISVVSNGIEQDYILDRMD